jgi:hypothetical protein
MRTGRAAGGVQWLTRSEPTSFVVTGATLSVCHFAAAAILYISLFRGSGFSPSTVGKNNCGGALRFFFINILRELLLHFIGEKLIYGDR